MKPPVWMRVRWGAVAPLVLLVALVIVVYQVRSSAPGLDPRPQFTSKPLPTFPVPTNPSGASGARSGAASARARKLRSLLAHASDPGLPKIVGSVNGSPISARAVAQVEASLVYANPREKMGTPALRRQAFQILEQQVVTGEAARAKGLYPTLAVATREARALGDPTTPSSVHAVQTALAVVALRQQITDLRGQNGWTRYVAGLTAHARIVDRLPKATR